MKGLQLILPDESKTELLARQLASLLSSPLILTLSGVLGAGKTTFVRALLRALGVTSPIKSPTFTLVETYPLEAFTFHHFDFYRILDQTELEYIGFRDYFSDKTICCIEWPEKAGDFLKDADLHFLFTINENERRLDISAFTPSGENLLSHLRGKQ